MRIYSNSLRTSLSLQIDTFEGSIVTAWNKTTFGPKAKEIIASRQSANSIHIQEVTKLVAEIERKFHSLERLCQKLTSKSSWFSYKPLHDSYDTLLQKPKPSIEFLHELATKLGKPTFFRIFSIRRLRSFVLTDQIIHCASEIEQHFDKLLLIVKDGDLRNSLKHIERTFLAAQHIQLASDNSNKINLAIFSQGCRANLLELKKLSSDGSGIHLKNTKKMLSVRKRCFEIDTEMNQIRNPTPELYNARYKERQKLTQTIQELIDINRNYIATEGLLYLRVFRLAKQCVRDSQDVSSVTSQIAQLSEQIHEYSENLLDDTHGETISELYDYYRSQLVPTKTDNKKITVNLILRDIASACKDTFVTKDGDIQGIDSLVLENSIRSIRNILSTNQINNLNQLPKLPSRIKELVRRALLLNKLEEQEASETALRQQEELIEFSPELIRLGLSAVTVSKLFDKYKSAETILNKIDEIRDFIAINVDWEVLSKLEDLSELLFLDPTELMLHANRVNQIKRALLNLHGAEISSGTFKLPSIQQLMPSQIARLQKYIQRSTDKS